MRARHPKSHSNTQPAGKLRQLTRFKSHSILLALPLAIAGCMENGELTGQSIVAPADQRDAVAVADYGGRTTIAQGETEAPEVFGKTDLGLWDGRPSLGGVWIAHIDAPSAERVLITNTENEKSIVGALFRRERGSTGPRFQLSSDAAEALGILAGSPTKLEVVALRTVQTTEQQAPATSATNTGDNTAAKADEATDAAPAAAATAAATAAALSATPAPSKPTAPSIEAPASGDVLNETASSTAANAAAAANSDPTNTPNIQIGLFGVEENANNALSKLTKEGLQARATKTTLNGKDFWRVSVGPIATKSDLSAALAKVKSLGFSDAYASK